MTSSVEGCFTIDGAGEHNVEDETVTLALVNEDLFNFEVAGWYDTSGQLLSGEATYALTLARDCITDIEVRLKPRTVNITRQGIARIEFQYLVMEGGRPVPKVAYDYRTQYSADYKASELIKFYYEEYRLDRSKTRPSDSDRQQCRRSPKERGTRPTSGAATKNSPSRYAPATIRVSNSTITTDT